MFDGRIYLLPVILFFYLIREDNVFLAIMWPIIGILAIKHLETQVAVFRAKKIFNNWQKKQKQQALNKEYPRDMKARAHGNPVDQARLARLRENPPPIAASIALTFPTNDASIIFNQSTLLAYPVDNVDVKRWLNQPPSDSLDVCSVPILWLPAFLDIVRLGFRDKTCVIRCDRCERTYEPDALLHQTSSDLDIYACPMNHKIISIANPDVVPADNDGPGLSKETAIQVDSINEEYLWVERHYPGFEMTKQHLWQGKDGGHWNVLELEGGNGEIREIYFDISGFYGNDEGIFHRKVTGPWGVEGDYLRARSRVKRDFFVGAIAIVAVGAWYLYEWTLR